MAINSQTAQTTLEFTSLYSLGIVRAIVQVSDQNSLDRSAICDDREDLLAESKDTLTTKIQIIKTDVVIKYICLSNINFDPSALYKIDETIFISEKALRNISSVLQACRLPPHVVSSVRFLVDILETTTGRVVASSNFNGIQMLFYRRIQEDKDPENTLVAWVVLRLQKNIRLSPGYLNNECSFNYSTQLLYINNYFYINCEDIKTPIPAKYSLSSYSNTIYLIKTQCFILHNCHINWLITVHLQKIILFPNNHSNVYKLLVYIWLVEILGPPLNLHQGTENKNIITPTPVPIVITLSWKLKDLIPFLNQVIVYMNDIQQHINYYHFSLPCKHCPDKMAILLKTSLHIFFFFYILFTSPKATGSNVGNLYTAISLELYAPVANNVLDGLIFNECIPLC
ncbi:hypothetical protein AGLY_012107 [Aphis glycines]|uniref:Uncharacterized protein n=1 Tax=Aphis glycines TaxID=307491 RepID=A0A6G0T9A9_APHGL|nr:hypothetical protein AGLY_012107 [Aphis glycines]